MDKKEYLINRLEAIKNELKALSKDYDMLEYSLICSKFSDEDRSYEFGFHDYQINNPKNIDQYKNVLTAVKADIFETKRFTTVNNLEEFIVVCKDDTITNEARQSQIRNGGDWLIRDKSYTVINRKKSINGVGYSFTLKDRATGDILQPPFPFEGYHSSRFKLIDYSNLN